MNSEISNISSGNQTSNNTRDVRALGVDAGGTMTDTIFIDSNGGFIVGKSQSTPDHEAEGFMNSVVDALHYWNMDAFEVFPDIATGVYSGTSMLNRLLERKGQRVGLIVSKGMEDYLKLERGVQTHLGYSYADSLHVVTHQHHEPLVPRYLIKGVGGRLDSIGNEAIPLYVEDVRVAVKTLLENDVDCICVNLLFSWRNPVHECLVEKLAFEVMERESHIVPIMLSSTMYPKRLDFPRLNTLLIDAYAAEPSRHQFSEINQRMRDHGAKFELRIMAGAGGTIAIGAEQLVNTLASGPIGGCVAAKYLAENMGIQNLVCTDIGGTSFDLALISNGNYEICTDPNIEHYKMNFPMIRISSIGSGCGSLVRINPISQRIDIGPDSAGSKVGVGNTSGGLQTVSITDCNLALGFVNPDYFLGGEVQLDRDAAIRAIEEQIAKPLGLSVEDAAAGVIDLFEDELRREVQSLILGKGYSTTDFALISYGGGGPVHAGSYTSGLNFLDVLVPTWAAGFSAFGCVCADFEYRFDQQTDFVVPPFATDQQLETIVESLNSIWDSLKTKVEKEFEKSGVSTGVISTQPMVRMQYLGQLNDIEVTCPSEKITNVSELRRVIEEFETVYSRLYASSAKSPELGYMITLAIMKGQVPIEKPVIPNDPIVGEEPDEIARKEPRLVYAKGRWVEAQIFEMDLLRSGNVLRGLAIVEAPSTTFVIPEGRIARLDEHRVFHLKDDLEK